MWNLFMVYGQAFFLKKFMINIVCIVAACISVGYYFWKIWKDLQKGIPLIAVSSSKGAFVIFSLSVFCASGIVRMFLCLAVSFVFLAALIYLRHNKKIAEKYQEELQGFQKEMI